MKRNLLYISLITMLFLGLNACSWLPKQKDETAGWSAKKLYDTAKGLMVKKDYDRAIKYFVILEARYPFGKYAKQGQLELAFSYFKNEDFEKGLAACTRFIRLNPSHPNVDYAYYLKGLINYRNKKGIAAKIFPVDPSTRDPGTAAKSFFNFKTLVEKFPNSKYAKDARQRMLFLRNNLAKHEIIIARHYMQRGAYVAAANRAKYVLEHYEKSPSIKNAVEALVISYDRLKLTKLKTGAERVLKKNYPHHPLLTEGSKRNRWIKKWIKKK